MTVPVKVLTVGAAGPFAGLVVPELVQRGASVRGLAQEASQEDAVRAKGAIEVAVGDLNDMAAMAAALQGIDRVFYIAPAFADDEAGMGTKFVTAAVKAGVRRIVFSGVIHPILGALSNHRDKGPVEEAIISSGMEYTFLHPARFMQDHALVWPVVTAKGVLAEPYRADQRMSWVDYRDVAEAAAVALTEDRLLSGTFELCAEGQPTRREVAAWAGDVLGHEVVAGSPRFEQWAEDVDLPGGEEQRAGRKIMFDWYDAHPLLGNALTLRAVLAREPRMLRAYLAELATGTGS